jgi:hypothetical protein
MPELFRDLFDDGGSDGPVLSPDLEELYEQLLDDGTRWQEDVPTMPGLDATVEELVQGMHVPARGDRQVLREKSPSISIARADDWKRGTRTIRNRSSGIVSIAAMVVVVALLITVFQAKGHGRSPIPAAHRSPTVTVPANTGWQPLAALAYTSERPDDSGPAVAPSDPEVIYEANAGRDWTPTDGPRFLRRTDNAGATWHNLPFPVPATRVHWADFLVSPLDPHTVILQIADDTLSDCPASFDVTFPGAYVMCELQYFSSNGGTSWTLLQTPMSNLMSLSGTIAPSSDSAIQNQGNRLYAGVSCPNSGCTHLVVSTDGGHTWNIVDRQLFAVEPFVCGFEAALSGRALFAVTSNMNCAYSYRQPHAVLSLWRSNDGGAAWNLMATLPTPNLFGLLAVDSGNPARPLLYAYMPRTLSVTMDKANMPQINPSDKASDIYCSVDDGITWHPAPEAGLPTGFIPFSAPLGVLSDGTMIASFNTQGTLSDSQDLNGSTLFGWRLGETAWHQIAPPLSEQLMVLAIQPETDGRDTLWVFEMSFNEGSIDSYTALRAQAPGP